MKVAGTKASSISLWRVMAQASSKRLRSLIADQIAFHSSYWVTVSAASMSVDVGATCAGLPQYPDTRTENPARYALIGDTEVIARVVAETANLRTGPGTSYPLVSSVPGGTEMVIIGRNGIASAAPESMEMILACGRSARRKYA